MKEEDVMALHERGSDNSTKAYYITYAVANEMGVVIHADSAEDALQRFRDGEGDPEITGYEWRCRRPKAHRLPDEDRDA